MKLLALAIIPINNNYNKNIKKSLYDCHITMTMFTHQHYHVQFVFQLLYPCCIRMNGNYKKSIVLIFRCITEYMLIYETTVKINCKFNHKIIVYINTVKTVDVLFVFDNPRDYELIIMYLSYLFITFILNNSCANILSVINLNI